MAKGVIEIEDKHCWGYSKEDSFALTEEAPLLEMEKGADDEKLRVWAKQIHLHGTRLKEIPVMDVNIDTAAEPGITVNLVGTTMASLSTLIHSNERLSSEQISDKMLEIQFKILSEKWKNESKYISLVKKSFKLESYQEIIKMGEKVIPFLLKELSETNKYWFEALREITKQNPVKPANYNDFKKMTDDWLGWGRENGYYLL
jgi:hypothetical protein